MNIELKIGVGNADIGAFALFFAEIVDDGVFCLVGDKFRMPKLLRINDSIYRKSSLQIKVFVPSDPWKVLAMISNSCIECDKASIAVTIYLSTFRL